MTFDNLCSLAATQIGIEPQALNPDASLIDQGLDSMRMIALIEELRVQGVEADFFALAECVSLRDWASALGIEA
ncbi:MAG: phosphopantetheine-binding protein [Corynebacterium sp.]|nr:phosphopantetheine-binding protein [Corynebacterium sp.]